MRSCNPCQADAYECDENDGYFDAFAMRFASFQSVRDSKCRSSVHKGQRRNCFRRLLLHIAIRAPSPALSRAHAASMTRIRAREGTEAECDAHMLRSGSSDETKVFVLVCYFPHTNAISCGMGNARYMKDNVCRIGICITKKYRAYSSRSQAVPGCSFKLSPLSKAGEKTSRAASLLARESKTSVYINI